MRRILITINNIELTATLTDSKTADKIYNNLPFKAIVQRWGNEISFELPVTVADEKDATKKVEVGDIACWSYGSTFCIFFGKTPLSRWKKPRASSFVNILGKIEGDLEALKDVQSQSQVQVKKVIEQKKDIAITNPGFVIKYPDRKKVANW